MIRPNRSRLCPLIPPANVTVFRSGSLRFASPPPWCSCASAAGAMPPSAARPIATAIRARRATRAPDIVRNVISYLTSMWSVGGVGRLRCRRFSARERSGTGSKPNVYSRLGAPCRGIWDGGRAGLHLPRGHLLERLAAADEAEVPLALPQDLGSRGVGVVVDGRHGGAVGAS